MSNIFYHATILPQEEKTLVINSNDVMDEVINEHIRLKEKAQRSAPREEEVTAVPVLDEEGNPVLDENGDPLIQQLLVDLDEEEEIATEPEVDYVALAQEEAEHIITQARMEADNLMVQAENEAEALRLHIREEARKEGYDAGLTEAAKASAEMERKALLRAKELEAEYAAKFESMERELVDLISDIVAKALGAELSGDQQVIYHLLDNTLSNIPNSKTFLIRVNEANCAYLRSRRADIEDKVGADVVLDIVTDPLLTDDQCMIETDGGLFDCGIDTQLRNIIGKIKALS